MKSLFDLNPRFVKRKSEFRCGLETQTELQSNEEGVTLRFALARSAASHPKSQATPSPLLSGRIPSATRRVRSPPLPPAPGASSPGSHVAVLEHEGEHEVAPRPASSREGEESHPPFYPLPLRLLLEPRGSGALVRGWARNALMRELVFLGCARDGRVGSRDTGT